MAPRVATGARINADAVAQRLYDIQVHSRIRAAGLSNLPKEFSDLEQLRDHIRHWLCNDWATILTGSTLSGAVANPAITKSPQAYCSAGQDPDVNVRFELTRDCNWLKARNNQFRRIVAAPIGDQRTN
jgi:hypothetical protein